MKEIFSSFFEKMTSLTMMLSGALCEERCVITPESALERSRMLRNECVERAEKQFITPICREDIVTICLKIHRLNCNIYDILKNNLYELSSRRFTLEITELYKLCRRLHGVFENGFPKKYSDALDVEYILKSKATEKSRYNYTEFMYEQLLYSRIKSCYDAVIDILELVVVTVIKNT
ncbi:MAG: hypothetical protein E7593_00715 [Ruminococcaceae bacterium]|nr:hypothetical protein [Oscillospiraceae bacterium]